MNGRRRQLPSSPPSRVWRALTALRCSWLLPTWNKGEEEEEAEKETVNVEGREGSGRRMTALVRCSESNSSTSLAVALVSLCLHPSICSALWHLSRLNLVAPRPRPPVAPVRKTLEKKSNIHSSSSSVGKPLSKKHVTSSMSTAGQRLRFCTFLQRLEVLTA